MAFNKNILSQAVLFVLGAAAAVIFVASKSPALTDRLIYNSYIYGDLYRLSKVNYFKPSAAIHGGPSVNMDSFTANQSPAGTEVFFVGDSFGFADWGAGTLPLQLAAATHKKVFSVYNNAHYEMNEYPLEFIRSLSLPRAKRIFVYERVERLIPRALDEKASDLLETNHPVYVTRPLSLSEIIFKNSEEHQEMLLKDSAFTCPFLTMYYSMQFRLFRRISKDTPAYSLRPPFLFYKDEYACFKTSHDDAFINRLADNVAMFARKLREDYDCDFVFIPLPNKITVYSSLMTNLPYDNFLPRLCAATKQRGIRTVDLLPAFQAQTNLLYWPTDTHWNGLGVSIALQETLKVWPQPQK
ncbi:MAG TPA: hypothetical protein VH255_05435 [Verrucomicrobiae bacterium]|jgi:hypothetical protein|nr:hypothetical protein [Verrucomicrobiae bacterium]